MNILENEVIITITTIWDALGFYFPRETDTSSNHFPESEPDSMII